MITLIMKLIHQISFIKEKMVGVRYTFKTTVNDKTIYISGMNTEILELQKSMWKYLSLIGIIVLCDLFSC